MTFLGVSGASGTTFPLPVFAFFSDCSDPGALRRVRLMRMEIVRKLPSRGFCFADLPFSAKPGFVERAGVFLAFSLSISSLSVDMHQPIEVLRIAPVRRLLSRN